MPQLQTLGDVLTCALALVAVCVVPIKLARVWWPVARARIAPVFMSSEAPSRDQNRTVAEPLPATSTIEAQRIAMPGNAVNDELPGNPLPEEVRAIIRFQKGVEDAVKIIRSGKIGQTEAIELIFECKRSGRADSPYGRARAAVQAQLGPERPIYYDDLRAQVEAEHEPTTA